MTHELNATDHVVRDQVHALHLRAHVIHAIVQACVHALHTGTPNTINAVPNLLLAL